MNETGPAVPRRGARTFRGACFVLASVAVVQAAATAWSVRTAEKAIAENLTAIKPAGPVPAPAAPASDPFNAGYTPSDDPHPELQAPAGEPPLNDPALAMIKAEAVISMPGAPAPRPPAPLDTRITAPEILRNLDEGLHLRSQGDMQGALTHFRQALKKQPDHPKLLYHAAKTLDIMGLTARADVHWKILYQLGEGAGDFYKLAQERMADGPQTANEPEEAKEGRFTVTALDEEKVPDPLGGERVRFTVTLKKNTEEAVDVSRLRDDMVIAIHFFDTVNRRRIARSHVPQPELSCTTAPADWTNGPETFTFDYYQPDMSPEQLVRHGRCRFYGCALEVFYKQQLQDAAATTPELEQLARELPLPPPESEESILESTSAPVTGPQPEPSLFPPVLTP